MKYIEQFKTVEEVEEALKNLSDEDVDLVAGELLEMINVYCKWHNESFNLPQTNCDIGMILHLCIRSYRKFFES